MLVTTSETISPPSGNTTSALVSVKPLPTCSSHCLKVTYDVSRGVNDSALLLGIWDGRSEAVALRKSASRCGTASDSRQQSPVHLDTIPRRAILRESTSQA